MTRKLLLALAGLVSAKIQQYQFKTAHHALFKREISEELLKNDTDLMYLFLGDIQVGTPAQSLQVLFDTGSYKLWVRGADCQGCQKQNCTNGIDVTLCKPSFNGTKSSTYTRTSAIESLAYNSGQAIDGIQVYDYVELAGIGVKNFSFVKATKMNSLVSFDGVLGMGVFPRNGLLLVDQMIKQKQLDRPVFSFWISANGIDAQLTLGGIDRAKLASEITWIPLLIQKRYPYWQTAFGDIKIESQTPSTFKIPAGMPAIFDSGTSFSYLPDAYASALNAALGASVYPAGSSDSSISYSFQNCPDRDTAFSQLPDLILVFGGNEFKVTSREYMTFLPGNPDNLCLSSFFGSTASSPIFLLGNAIMRRWVVVYDMDNLRIGLAESNQTATESDLSTNGLPQLSSNYSSIGVDITIIYETATAKQATSTPTSLVLPQKSNGDGTSKSLLALLIAVIAIII